MRSSRIVKWIYLIIFFFSVYGCATSKPLPQTQEPEPLKKVSKASLIQRVSFNEAEDYTRIQIEGLDSLPLPFYKLDSDPLSIVVDIPDIDLKQIKNPITIDNGTISKVTVAQYDGKGRIQIGLLQMTNYNISREDRVVLIDIEKVKKITEGKENPIKEKGVDISQTESKKEEVLPPPPIANPPSEILPEAKEILNFLLEQKKDFITFNIIADGKLVNYEAYKLDSPARLVLDIFGVDTQVQQKSLKMKNPYIKEVRFGHFSDKLRVVFDSLKPQLPPYQINRIHDKLVISFGNVPSLLSLKLIYRRSPLKLGSPVL